MAVISLMEREFVQKRRLLTAEEFLHGVGLGQILGSFAVNAAFFIGYRLFGPAGGILSVGAFLTPSLTLVIALAHFYFRYHSMPALQGAVAGLGPVVIALILDAAWSLGRQVLRSRIAVCYRGSSPGGGSVQRQCRMGDPGCRNGGAPDAGRTRWGGPGAGDSSRMSGVLAIPAMVGPFTLLGLTAITFLRVGLVFFGGGFVLVPVLHHRLVTQLHWLNSREFLDGVAISNLTPGPISVLATFAGFRVAGVSGRSGCHRGSDGSGDGAHVVNERAVRALSGRRSRSAVSGGRESGGGRTHLECGVGTGTERDCFLEGLGFLRSVLAAAAEIPVAPGVPAGHWSNRGLCRAAALIGLQVLLRIHPLHAKFGEFAA